MITERRIATLISTMLCSHLIMGQQWSDTTSHLKDEHIMGEVVVTGQYSAGLSDNAVQKIRVTDRKKIEAMNAQTLRDVLTNEMNIRLSQDNILGSSMSMQGMSGENVKILIDGVPVIGRQDGNIDLSQISLANIERIEIIEGPMSVNYGTDALAGTINLITKKIQRNGIETNLSTYYESIGTYNINFRTGLHRGRQTLSLTGGRNFFDGWNYGDKTAVDFSPHVADSSRVLQWKPREQYFAGLLYSYKAGKTTINYKCDLFHEKITNRGLPTLPYGQNAFDDYYYTGRIDNVIFVNNTIAGKRNINFMAAYNDYTRTKNTYYADLTTLDKSLSTNIGDQDTSKFHAMTSRATYSSSKTGVKLNYEVGYDINISDATGSRIKNYRQTIGDYAAFVSAEYKLMNQITIRPGVRYGYNTAYSSPAIPSLNLRYKATDDLTIRGSYAKGFRAPSLKELYFYFVDINHNIKGNEQLNAEYSENYSLSAVFSKNKSWYNYKVEGTAYYNDIRDLITLAQTTGTEYSYVNIGKYKTKGIQANAEVTISNVKCSFGASYMGTYNQLSETENIATFSYSPEARGSISWELKRCGVTVALFYKYIGRLPTFVIDGSGTIRPSFIDAYHTADISISKPFFAKRLAVSVGCKNIFNVTNVASYAAGGTHSSASDNTPISCGRLYCIKTDINLKKK